MWAKRAFCCVFISFFQTPDGETSSSFTWRPPVCTRRAAASPLLPGVNTETNLCTMPFRLPCKSTLLFGFEVTGWGFPVVSLHPEANPPWLWLSVILGTFSFVLMWGVTLRWREHEASRTVPCETWGASESFSPKWSEMYFINVLTEPQKHMRLLHTYSIYPLNSERVGSKNLLWKAQFDK